MHRLINLSAESKILVVTDIVLNEYERLLAQESDVVSQDPAAVRFLEGVEQALNTVGVTVVSSL